MTENNKKSISNFYGLFQFVRQTYVSYRREKFDVKEEWFDILYQRHYTGEFDAKYDTDLYVEQGHASELIKLISFNKKLEEVRKELCSQADFLVEFLGFCEKNKQLLEKESIELNLQSNQYSIFEIIIQTIEKLQTNITGNITIIDSFDKKTFADLLGFDIGDLFGYWRSFPYDEDIYILEEPHNRYFSQNITQRLNKIIQHQGKINGKLDSIQNQIFIIHGSAGMGKSNLSARLVQECNKKGIGVIPLKAKSFSGESTDFESILMRNLEVPNDYSISEVLEKINNYAISKKQRVCFLIDGLNETSFTNQGFSDIWKVHLDNFIHRIRTYSNLIFITTLRSSYIDRIWNESIPYYNLQLNGFSDENLKEVIPKYFKEYRIVGLELEPSDIFYFRTPLLLDLYCKMINSNKTMEVDALLGLTGFKQVFENYIKKLAREIYKDLKLPTRAKIFRGIESCSKSFVNQLQEYIGIECYYESFDESEIANINKSIGHRVLEGYLIFIKDTIKNEDVIYFTQQEVGGYLLAKYLLETYVNIEKVVKSDFFQNHLVGDDENLHQLKDDILKFIIVESQDRNDIITKYVKNDSINKFLFLKLQRDPVSDQNIILREELVSEFKTKKDIYDFLLISKDNLTQINSSLDIKFAINLLTSLNNFDFETVWTKFTYSQYDTFIGFIDDFRVDTLTSDQELGIDENSSLKLELAIWLLETTIIDIRDKATQVLLEYGTICPDYIFNKLFEFSTTNRLYIYERLASIAYGICLRKQNDDNFTQCLLKEIAPRIYNLQFSKVPDAPSYHYIVIDSLKHIIDLAIHKGIFDLNQDEKELLNQYQFIPVEEWVHATEEDLEKVQPIVASWHNQNPDPLGKDFVTYTIPRLLVRDYDMGDEYGKIHIEATAQIYRRAILSGYIPEEDFKAECDAEQQFYHGHDIQYPRKKVDRLGKKYSWNAFFEYAGFLLNENKLDVWYKDTDTEPHYKRLSDIELEPSFPVPKVVRERLFKKELLDHKSEDPDWTKKEVYDLSREIWNYKFKEGDFTLLKGQLIQKLDNSYDVESSLLIDAFLVSKQDLESEIENIVNYNFDWNNDFSTSGGHLTHVYFGELYWADSISSLKMSSENIILKDFIKKPNIDMAALLGNAKSKKDLRDIISVVKSDKNIHLSVLPAYMEYGWESESDVYPSIRDIIPVSNMGKYLGLKSDPKNLLLLDKDGSPACKTVKFKHEEMIEQSLNYLRTDLLQKYLDDNDMVLMYQIKQHTYDRKAGDGNGDFRGMQFFFPHLNTK